MKNLNKIFTLAGVLGVAGAAGMAMFAKPAEAIASWGPQDRETFTWASPSTYRTFNSITDNPSLGDERNFVRIREYGTDNNFTDDVNLVAGKTYEVYVYFHNNASANLNTSGVGIADNVRLAMEMPTEVNAGEAAVIKGTISSTNTTPASVWDTAYLSANETVFLRYVQGSAAIHNGGSANGEKLDDVALWGSGSKLAYWKEEWGMIPGCNEYAGYVTFQVKADQPRFYIAKEISTDGGNTWTETATVAPGATVKFRVAYNNVGTTEQTNVTLYDVMADGMTLIAGTTKAKIPANADYVSVEDAAWENGLGIGNYLPDQEGIVVYDVKIEDDTEVFACGNTVIYNNASVATANGTMYDKVKLTVNRDCGTVTEMPDTGPAEIVLAIVIAMGIGAGGLYWYQSRKTLKEVKDTLAGNDKM